MTVVSRALPTIGHTKTLSERVYELLRTRLLEEDIAPGTILREQELCDAFKVSRTPVREALNRLKSEGFLEHKPHRGFRVPKQSMQDLFHLYPVLCALEVLASELAFPRMTAEDCEQLRLINRRFDAALTKQNVSEAVKYNDQFHHKLGVMSGNPVLCSYIDDLRAKVRRLELWDFSKLFADAGQAGASEGFNWSQQHENIIDALSRGDVEIAQQILDEHRRASSLYLMQSETLRTDQDRRRK